MKISTILHHIDSGHMALPEFQRGYVWNRDQVRALFDSLNRRHPVGGLLVWVTDSDTAVHRGDGEIAPGVVKLLLDGQQRITTLYGVARGQAPKFFDGNADTFIGLHFHLDTQEFSFWQPVKMRDDPLWVSLSELFQGGMDGMGKMIEKLNCSPEFTANMGKYVSRISGILGIMDIDLHIEEVTGKDKTIDVVVDIFNRVNSGGTKLSKGDLALAKICADWPEARDVMKADLARWQAAGFAFDLDWLLRSVNTVLTGEAKFQFLHDKTASEIVDALKRATKQIDASLNLISGRLGLDHDRVLFGRFGIPVMVRYLDQHSGPLSAAALDKLLFWFAQAGMRGRFSGSTESYIDQDLAALERDGDPLDNLLHQLRLWQGSFRVEADHFAATSLGARFYPVLYMLTRMGAARDWGTGLSLKSSLLGKMSKLEVHHIFPKALLYKAGYERSEVNAIANFNFQTKATNLAIGARTPHEYFKEIEAEHPGALASQWIPLDDELWRVENYQEFLAARRTLLAEEANLRFGELLHSDQGWMVAQGITAPARVLPRPGGISGPDEQVVLEALATWVAAKGLPRGELAFEHIDALSDEPTVLLDLAWPQGLQVGLGQPVCVLLHEEPSALAEASAAGYRYFTDVDSFKEYVSREVLG